jgi:hypothetical protein
MHDGLRRREFRREVVMVHDEDVNTLATRECDGFRCGDPCVDGEQHVDTRLQHVLHERSRQSIAIVDAMGEANPGFKTPATQRSHEEPGRCDAITVVVTHDGHTLARSRRLF